MKKLKIYAVSVLAVMLLNVPIIFAENETIVVEGEATTTQMEYKNCDNIVFEIKNTGKLTVQENVVFDSNSKDSLDNEGGTVIIKDNVKFSSSHVCIRNYYGKVVVGNNLYFSNTYGITSNANSEEETDISLGNNINFTSNITNDGNGGAIRNSSRSKMTIGNNVKFIGNISKDNSTMFHRGGGAIFNEARSNGSIASLTVGENAYFYKNEANYGGAVYVRRDSKTVIGKNAIFSSNKARTSGGAIKTYLEDGKAPEIVFGSNVQFTDNEARENGGAIEMQGGTITIEDGAKFTNNKAKGKGGAIYLQGTLNLTAKTNDVEFTGNTANGVSNAIYGYGTINLWSGNKNIIFNDRMESTYVTVTSDNILFNINQSSGTLPTTGKIIFNEDMSGCAGTINLYNGTMELGKNGKWFHENTKINIEGSNTTINLANGFIQEHNIYQLVLHNNAKLVVDADLKNGEMDKVSVASTIHEDGKITVSKINILSDIEENETTEIEFANDILKGKVESVNKASSLFYDYDVVYDSETGCFAFTNTGENKIINLGTAASAVAASVGGYATQSVVVNQVFAGMDGKTSNKNQKSANINSSNLYVSAGDQVFEDSGKIEKGLWLRPFVLNETVKVGDTDVDNNLYGTLAGIDFPLGQDKQISFYLGYAGSKQEVEEIKANQTGYIVGATGMIIKNSWYAGLTANAIFNKASVDTDFGTDDIDMNMFTVAAKAGYNYNINEKWTLEPNITLMYGMVNSQSYETSQGAKIDSQSVNNILVDPEVKAKLGLANGWQPYALVGYAANLSSKPTVKAEGVELELDSIDGYVEYGLGVNKDFVGTVWSCYAQVTGRSGGRNGFAGNLGVKYKF